MSTARKVFFGIFGFGLLGGLVIGLINLVAPEATSVTFNDQNVEGLAALWTSIFAGGMPGLFLGLIGAGVTSLFARKKKSD